MRQGIAIVALLGCCTLGCAGGQVNRPCGPGYLGNIFIPQGFHGADFRNACYGHDSCYATPGADRKACDDQFLHELNCTCECADHPRLCRVRAKQWYRAVRLFGGRGFHQVQRDACTSCACGETLDEPAPVVDHGDGG